MDLFPDERINIDLPEQAHIAEIGNDQIDEKYATGDVRIVTEQARYPLSSIAAMVESDAYELNPDFQRRHRWSIEKQSRLIESFIMNIPIPPIFLYEDEFSHYQVMDGLQRLTAIFEFYTDRFSLLDLKEWAELNGRTYSTLPNQVRKGVDRRYLSSIILLHETSQDPNEAQRLKQLVFERINSGGEVLEYQESRNAIYDGPLNRLCIRLARTPALCKTWKIPQPTEAEIKSGEISEDLMKNPIYKKMDDVELVLRFFAYRQRLENQRGSLKTYLDKYIKLGNLFPQHVLDLLENLFLKTINLVFETLGESAFCLLRRRNDEWQWYKRPTTVVYDPLMFVFSRYIDRYDDVVSAKGEIKTRLESLYKNKYDEFEGRYTNLRNITTRNTLFTNLFTETIGSINESGS